MSNGTANRNPSRANTRWPLGTYRAMLAPSSTVRRSPVDGRTASIRASS